jgi:AAA domain
VIVSPGTTGDIQKKFDIIEREVREHVADRGRLAIIQAPPGSGKTWLLLKTVDAAFRLGRRIAIATQTNAQANDICRRFAQDYPKLQVIRFASGRASQEDLGRSIGWNTETKNLPNGKCIVVATTAKWSLVDLHDSFDVVFVEEAWQMGWADFMLLGQVAERFVLIGDPGQIPPVVSVDVLRWETSPRPPHIAAPRVILAEPRYRPEQWQLPATRRLPHDAAALVRQFYDFDFGAFAQPGERAILAARGGNDATDRVIDSLARASVAALTIPTPDEGPPMHSDAELARHAAALVQRLLSRDAHVRKDNKTQPLRPEDIGICSTHRVMNSELALTLPRSLRGRVIVDTPERWQGLERALMIFVHPLSGVVRPTSFDLETGRLCVMASRHTAGAVILARDHVTETLETCIPSATQPVGRPDVSGRGLFDNLSFWSSLRERGQVHR